MFSIYEILIILVIHWLAEYPFQSDHVGKTKNHSLTSRLTYAAISSGNWLYIGFIWLMASFDHYSMEDPWAAVMDFFVITLLTRLIISYFFSKLIAKRFKVASFNGWKGGLTIMAIEQTLYLAQVFLCYDSFFK